MARLPSVGGDNGQWGQILNDFLSVEHNADGTLKKAGDISAAQATANAKYTKPAGGIPEADLDSGVQAKLNGAGASDATTSSKGVVQLAGDLGGTAASPTVPGLSSKENVANKSTTTSLGTSDTLYPTQNAVKSYVDTAVSGISGNFIENGTSPQTADFNITGDGVMGGNLTVNGIAPDQLNGSVLKVNGELTSTSNNQAGLGIFPYINPPSASTASFLGVSFLPVSDTNYLSTGFVSGLFGGFYYYGSGSVQHANGGYFQLQNQGSGTLANAIGVQIYTPQNTGTITRNTGLAISNHDTGTNNTNILVGTTAAPTGNYSIYNTSAYNNYFAGRLAIGTTTFSSQLSLGNSGAANGITLGGDTTLYRSAASTLATDGNITIAGGTIQLGADVNIYRGAANVLQSDDSFRSSGFLRASNTGAGQVQIGGVGPSSEAAISFGSTGDAVIYRSGANRINTSSVFSTVTSFSDLSGSLGSMINNPTYTPASDDGIGLFMLAFQNQPTYNSTISKTAGGTFLGGIFINPIINNTGTVPIKGLDVTTSVSGGGTVPNYRAIHVRAPGVSGTGTALTNSYGIWIDNQRPAGVSAGFGIFFNGTSTQGSDINWNGDTNLYRYAANTLATDDNLYVLGGALQLGSDTSIFRNSADELRTNDRFVLRPTVGTGGIVAALDIDNVPTAATTRTQGASIFATVNTGSEPTGYVAGVEGRVISNSTGTIPRADGMLYQVENRSSGTMTQARGAAVDISNYTAGTGTIGTAVGLQVDIRKTTGAITTGYGLYLNSNDATTGWGVYQLAGGYNYFSGNIGLGVSSSASITSKLTFAAATNAAGGILFGTDTNLYRSAADTLKTDDNLIVAAAGTVANSVATIDATQTLTNKRITQRVSSTASSATPTPNANTDDVYILTALAAAAAFAAPSGTPTDGQSLVIRIKDNGTARALTWNAIYRAIGTALPTTTVISKTLYLGFKYNAADTKWDCLAVSQEA